MCTAVPVVRLNEPRRGKRQGKHKTLLASRSPRSRCAPEDRACVEFKTTLGNGYLGSRIDEERSKMRYLV